MARSRAYRRHQAARAKARAYRIARRWHSDSSDAEFAAFVEANPAWFGVVVSTHARPCSGACCSYSQRYVRQSHRADDAYREALADTFSE